MLSIWTMIMVGLSCAAVSPSARAAYVTTQHIFTTYGLIHVPHGTWRIDFIVKGGSGGSPPTGTTHERSKGGRGGEIGFSLAYGHGYKAGDVLLIYPGSQANGINSGYPFQGGDIGVKPPGLDGGSGIWGGDGSGVYNQTQGRWLVIAGGGGGAGGQLYENGGNGGDAGHPGGGGLVFGQPAGGAGGAAGGPCAPPPPLAPTAGAGEKGRDAIAPSGGSGGGGGGGCNGGAGGRTGAALAGGGGGGGSNYIYGEATNVTQGLAPAGSGSVRVSITTYHEPPPLIVSPDKAIFVAGQPACFDVIGVGRPPPNVHVSGHFPEGLSFRVPLFSGIGEIRGTPTSASIGMHSVAFTMHNDWGTANQTLTIEVVTPEHAPAGANICNP